MLHTQGPILFIIQWREAVTKNCKKICYTSIASLSEWDRESVCAWVSEWVRVRMSEWVSEWLFYAVEQELHLRPSSRRQHFFQLLPLNFSPFAASYEQQGVPGTCLLYPPLSKWTASYCPTRMGVGSPGSLHAGLVQNKLKGSVYMLQILHVSLHCIYAARHRSMLESVFKIIHNMLPSFNQKH